MSSDFSKQLIKGRIAETIFEQMFCDAGDYTVIPFGYEKTVPEIARQNKLSRSLIAQKVIDNIRTAPDYVVIFPDKKTIFLVEVKFESKLNIDTIKEIAKKQSERWDPSWLFVATLNGFYFGECSRILQHGKILPLEEAKVSKEIQNKYLKLLGEFEK
jgi:hypothetical protein